MIFINRRFIITSVVVVFFIGLYLFKIRYEKNKNNHLNRKGVENEVFIYSAAKKYILKDLMIPQFGQEMISAVIVEGEIP